MTSEVTGVHYFEVAEKLWSSVELPKIVSFNELKWAKVGRLDPRFAIMEFEKPRKNN